MKIKDNNKTKILFMLGFCLIMGLILRLWAIDFGLPFFRHVDEFNYLPHALKILRSQDLNPHYFHNPPLLTYLYSIVLFLYFIFGKLLVQCIRLLGPQFRKVKIRFLSEIP